MPHSCASSDRKLWNGSSLESSSTAPWVCLGTQRLSFRCAWVQQTPTSQPPSAETPCSDAPPPHPPAATTRGSRKAVTSKHFSPCNGEACRSSAGLAARVRTFHFTFAAVPACLLRFHQPHSNCDSICWLGFRMFPLFLISGLISKLPPFSQLSRIYFKLLLLAARFGYS